LQKEAAVGSDEETVGSVIDRAVMYCLQFDAEKNTCPADAFNIMKIGSALTVLLTGTFLFVQWR